MGGGLLERADELRKERHLFGVPVDCPGCGTEARVGVRSGAVQLSCECDLSLEDRERMWRAVR